jgi:hypothetical protein
MDTLATIWELMSSKSIKGSKRLDGVSRKKLSMVGYPPSLSKKEKRKEKAHIKLPKTLQKLSAIELGYPP